MSGKTVIAAEGLYKNYMIKSSKLGEKPKQLHAVSNVSLTVQEGCIFGVAGESGCGKSTLGRCLLRLEKITDGKVYFKGIDITDRTDRELKDIRREMQVIFQNPYASFDPRQKIGKAFREAANVYGMQDADQKIRDLLKKVNLPEDVLGRLPRELSGGQLQRLAIARALLPDPNFIVADEPVSALDVSVQAQILNLIMELREKDNITMLFISHDMSVLRHLCDKIAVMYLGSIVEEAETEELFGNLQHPYSQTLMSAIPRIHPDEKTERIIPEGDIPSAIDLPPGCTFADRCRFCTEICRKEKPPLKDIGNSHLVACHHAGTGGTK